MSANAKGLSLLEAMLAGVILVLSIVPVIGLLGSSSAEVTKAIARLIAVNLASSIAEEMRARRPADRAAYGPTAATALPHLMPVIQAHRAAVPAEATSVDLVLAGYVCQAVLGGTTAAPTVRAEVSWTESGAPKSYALTARMEGVP